MQFSIAPFSYGNASFTSDLQLAVSSSEKYPHIVHEEYSEEIDDEKCQDSMTDCNLDILEGNFLELHAEYYFPFFFLLQLNDASVLCGKDDIVSLSLNVDCLNIGFKKINLPDQSCEQ